MSEYRLIDTEQALVAEFRKLTGDGYLESLLGIGLALDEVADSDYLSITFDGHRHRFGIEYKLNAGSRDIERLAATKTGSLPGLLVTVSASSSLLRHCREQRVSCLDLHGHAWVKAPSFLISTAPNPPTRYRYETGARAPNPFSKKSTRLLRVLLASPERKWKQSELAEETGLATGLISRLLNHLAKIGRVAGERAAWRLEKPEELLDSWLEHDDWSARTTVKHFTSLERDFNRIANDLVEGIDGLAFTQWYAAFIRQPFTQPPLLSCYCRRIPSSDALAALGLTEVLTGGKVLLVVPRDEGVFQCSQREQELPLVCDVQIYLDLIKQGLRGTEQANALREWSGFRQ
jgi:hypothetical protein